MRAICALEVCDAAAPSPTRQVEQPVLGDALLPPGDTDRDAISETVCLTAAELKAGQVHAREVLHSLDKRAAQLLQRETVQRPVKIR